MDVISRFLVIYLEQHWKKSTHGVYIFLGKFLAFLALFFDLKFYAALSSAPP